ncbi:peptidylprolyl isomerase [Tumebacillus sp. DT12]|uniref:Peptidyl-prolyl cis-trans isomerase n=2 Tax=Tumebacillus lacus TaxID=2995335 RepID=A0ABT3WZE6_9BACL|nr:peptidylprolyl isomerase [Tumebacillus lacus]
MAIDKSKEYTAVLKTSKGDVTIKLLDDQAPNTVNNFVFLAKDHFYDGVKFHRIIKEFMIQTGDPLGNGRGGPGYKFADELPPAKPYAPGIVAMANAGPNTNGSQFFIGTGEGVVSLNKQPNYTVFGEVVGGMEAVQAIASTPVGQSETGEKSKPTEDVVIQSVEIQEK